MWSLKRFWNLSVFIFSTAACCSAFGQSGPGGTGGGQDGPNGDLLDFYEATINPLQGAKEFHPAEEPAFKEVLLPILNDLNQKVPTSEDMILAGLTQNKLHWYLTKRPIAASNDGCALFADDGVTQVAKQVNGTVVISEDWYNNEGKVNQAGIINHELLVFASGKKPADCTTDIRELNRTIFSEKNKSQIELRDSLNQFENGVNPALIKNVFVTRQQFIDFYHVIEDSTFNKGCQLTQGPTHEALYKIDFNTTGSAGDQLNKALGGGDSYNPPYDASIIMVYGSNGFTSNFTGHHETDQATGSQESYNSWTYESKAACQKDLEKAKEYLLGTRSDPSSNIFDLDTKPAYSPEVTTKAAPAVRPSDAASGPTNNQVSDVH